MVKDERRLHMGDILPVGEAVHDKVAQRIRIGDCNANHKVHCTGHMNHFSDFIQLTHMGAEALHRLSRVLAKPDKEECL